MIAHLTIKYSELFKSVWNLRIFLLNAWLKGKNTSVWIFFVWLCMADHWSQTSDKRSTNLNIFCPDARLKDMLANVIIFGYLLTKNRLDTIQFWSSISIWILIMKIDKLSSVRKISNVWSASSWNLDFDSNLCEVLKKSINTRFWKIFEEKLEMEKIFFFFHFSCNVDCIQTLQWSMPLKLIKFSY